MSAGGTQPRGVPAAEAARHVRGMFDGIAPTYDRANHLLSLSLDRYWRWRTVRALRQRLGSQSGPLPVLDLACGTGDLSVALAAGLGRDMHLVGADFSHAMLTRARAKALRRGQATEWIEADALRLPCADATFAAVATAFGFRNLEDYRAGLREFHRVLRPGGSLAILEFSRPTWPLLGPAFEFYFHRVLPRLGGWISGNPAAYRYLPDSVSRFPPPAELSEWMRAAGFARVACRRFAAGVAVLHIGEKPTYT